MITGPHMVDELRKAPDDTLSFDEATVEVSTVKIIQS